MKAILIAAGRSSRLRPLTDHCPKSLLPFRGKPLIQWALDNFRSVGISDISVIRGYLKEKMQLEGVQFFENTDFENNNILFSLLYARKKLEECVESGEDVIVSYADLFFDLAILKQLMANRDALTLMVDYKWLNSYALRTDNPPADAEKVLIDKNEKALAIGKFVASETTIPQCKVAEFLGLWKMSPAGIKNFLQFFDANNELLKPTDPFQGAKQFQKAYVTDLFQNMIEQGVTFSCVGSQGQWIEFDTVQDYRLHEVELK